MVDATNPVPDTATPDEAAHGTRADVLVVSRDSKFVRVATFLFRRVGCEVASNTGVEPLASLVRAHRAGVVLLDISDAPTSTLDAARAHDLRAPVVMVVEDGSRLSDRPAGALPKWRCFGTVLERVQDAGSQAEP